MSEKIFIRPPQLGGITTTNKPTTSPSSNSGTDFAEILAKQLGQDELKFSAHALKRLESRQIKLNQAELGLLQEAVKKAEAKGAKESLILMEKLALVVSIKNRTVITAVDNNSLKDNIFTNIDSAVIVK